MKKIILAMMLTTALAGCVTPPRLGPQATAKPVTAYETVVGFSAPDARWPTERWWSAYGDSQLDALIDEALTNAPTMAQASARLRKAQALVGVADAATLPTISADGSFTAGKPSTQDGIPILPERQGYHDYGRATLGFSWELDFWGKNRAAVAAATSDAQAANVDAAAARLLVSSSVAANYADFARLYADRDVLADTLAIREKSLRLVKARFEHGFDSDADLAQAEAGPPAARAELAQADEAIGLARNRLASLLGEGPDRGLRIERPKAPFLRAFGLPKNLSVDLLGRRPDVVAARWRAEAAAKRIKVARAQFYPNVNLLSFIGFDALGIGNLLNSGADVGGAGPAISLPIFDGGRRRANYRAARADDDLAIATYDETVNQAIREVADVVVSSRQLAIELSNASAAVVSNERAYRLAQLRYTAGAADFQSVLLVEDRLLTRRRVLSALQSRAFILDVSLTRSLGGGFSS
ncbi:efflux transporter outer membrane subunit [Sphingomonas sp. RB3P16]|uniref:efflux transporter outer membrane subunit n=1 Tax=Parasphingomonas frigoris TaxID=3096163 RepID=UPI002FC69D60